MTLSRRGFLGASAIPFAGSMFGPLLRWVPGGPDRCLVVVELVGGNDGLNTLIPVDDAAYAAARPTLGSVRKGAHEVAPGFALHPVMGELHALFRRDRVAAIHSVGYPTPDRSHFRSRDIWHAADPTLGANTSPLTTGWVGRAADWLASRGAELPAVGLGGIEVPLALQGEKVVAPVLRRVEDYTLLVPTGANARQRQAAIRALAEADAPAGAPALTEFVRDVSRAGVAQAGRLEAALAGYESKVEYPEGSAFARALQLTARVLVSGLGTRLCHVPLDGFDTHARQAPTHAGLLGQLARGLAAFCADLQSHGLLDRVTILVHSEFGRRVQENQSQGTDHGAAAPVFVIGGAGLQPGLHGTAPNLSKLDDGDLVATVDFRAVYAEVLEWLGVPVDAVLDEVPGRDELTLFG